MQPGIVFALAALLVIGAARADEPAKPAPPDGPAAVFKGDALVENLAGEWLATGTMTGRPFKHHVSADWVLNHQFLKLHIQDLEEPAKGHPRYEAMVFLGRDNTSERYVAHWIDIFGGRFSETLGYGVREGDAIRLAFEYPDGPFHTTFSWNGKAGTWAVLMRQKSAAGVWETFAEQTLARVANR